MKIKRTLKRTRNDLANMVLAAGYAICNWYFAGRLITVHTDEGPLRGFVETVADRTVYITVTTPTNNPDSLLKFTIKRVQVDLTHIERKAGVWHARP